MLYKPKQGEITPCFLSNYYSFSGIIIAKKDWEIGESNEFEEENGQKMLIN